LPSRREIAEHHRLPAHDRQGAMSRTDRTISGLPIDPVYRAAPGAPDGLPAPGDYPYTRGLHPEMYRTRLWTMRMFAGFGSPEDTNERFRFLLREGQTGLSVAFDMPTLMGYDPDHPLSEGEAGCGGVSVPSAADMSRMFDGIDLGAVSTSLTISGPAPVALAMFVVAAERAGVPRGRLRGTIQADILKEFIAQREWVVPERPAMRLIGDLIAFCTEEMPLWYPVSISGYHMREAGATAVQELAFTLADGLAYVEHLVARGMDPDRFLPRFSFYFNVGVDLFEDVAKVRAARRLWATLMRERVGARDPRSWQLRTHLQTSGASLTAQQPLLNVARVAIEALGAVLAGAQSVHTAAYDETLSIPTAESATLALRTQQLIAEETGVASVADPLGGSYYVEALTDAIESAAMAEIARIDELGGMVAAVEAGHPQQQIVEAAYAFQRQVDRGERRIVGVTAHVGPDGTDPPTHRPDRAAAERQVARIRRLRADRDPDAHRRALDGLRAACEGEDNVMPHLIAAAGADATVGELCDVLRERFGAYRDPGRW
jgi:methylmalonyl-CoA mutase, N-terminal domain